MTVLPSNHYSGHHKATEEESDPGTLERDLEKEMWMEGFRYSWRKMEVATQDRVGWSQVACGL